MTAARSAGHTRLTHWLGLLTVVLLAGHLIPLYVLHGGVAGPAGLDWNAMAERWSHPLWRVWDLLLVAVGGADAGLLLARWARGRADRRFSAICYAVLVLAVAGVGVAAVVSGASL